MEICFPLVKLLLNPKTRKSRKLKTMVVKLTVDIEVKNRDPTVKFLVH